MIERDILSITRGAIVHQVNCRKKAGAGLARQIREAYPLWYKRYRETEPHMGLVDFYGATPRLVIVSLYAQEDYGRCKGVVYTNYDALAWCLRQVRLWFSPKVPVYIPYGIGCGLAGGDWRIVSRIINKEIPNAILVKKPEKGEVCGSESTRDVSSILRLE
ncbi:Appr-1-p processing protein-like protein [Virus Rctr71]|nr:Appr-1-p processing protein-like protein [Virus Rctr71]